MREKYCWLYDKPGETVMQVQNQYGAARFPPPTAHHLAAPGSNKTSGLLVPGGDSHVPTRNPSLSVLAARRSPRDVGTAGQVHGKYHT